MTDMHTPRYAVFDNGRTPRGWVQIQRIDDHPDPLECDEVAAAYAVEAAGMHGTAMAYYEECNLLVPLLAGEPHITIDCECETPSTDKSDCRLKASLKAILGRHISIIPAAAADRLGLQYDSEDE